MGKHWWFCEEWGDRDGDVVGLTSLSHLIGVHEATPLLALLLLAIFKTSCTVKNEPSYLNAFIPLSLTPGGKRYHLTNEQIKHTTRERIPPRTRPAASIVFVKRYSLKKQAAVRERQWELASALFDEMEQRFRRDGGSYHTGKTRSSANPNDRGPRELRKTAVNPMAPTAVSYRLALQACASASAESAAAATAVLAASASAGGVEGSRIASARGHVDAGWHEQGVAAGREAAATVSEASLCRGEFSTRMREGGAGEKCGETGVAPVNDEPGLLRSAEPRFAARALSLVKKMADAGIRLRRDTVALAQRACANSGRVGAAVEIRQVATDAEARQADEFLGQWRRRV